VSIPDDADDWLIREVSATAGEPGLLRGYDTLGRDNGELRSVGGTRNDRWGMTIAATGVISPDDGKRLRLDGTDLTVRWGNWLFGANKMDRWWGPGRDGSLILSTNARPMAGVSLDRVRSVRPSVPILSWIGPWRFSGFLGSMESHRPDVNHPLFMAMRFSFQPAPILEFGLSRSAQFCGQNAAKTRPNCDLSTFGRVLIGQDNAGIRGLNPADEPGNQMAGFDARLVSPFKALPVALYAQMIGEDNSSSGIPERYLGLFGAETWVLRESGATWRGRLEYASTSCKWDRPKLEPNCGYRQGIFQSGYRYHTRNIGHTTDSDSESVSLSLGLTTELGTRWVARVVQAKLDRNGGADNYNPLTQGPAKFDSGELTWAGRLFNQDLSARVGYERRVPVSGASHAGAFGFIQWRKGLLH
jgi:hypothetical protein